MLSDKKNRPSTIHKQKEPIYNDEGVDLTIIRWMLSLSPVERLQVLQQNIQSIMRLRSAKRNP
jgi:hypothetical protein